jgi:hypothetical protein
MEASNGWRPKITKVASMCQVDHKCVTKVEKELMRFGKVLHPDMIKQKWWYGPDANTIDSLDAFILLMMYLDEPTRSLGTYMEILFRLTGCSALEYTISHFWARAFPSL